MHPQTLDRATKIAAVREETIEAVVERFGEDALHRAPGSFSKHIPRLRRFEIAEAGAADGIAWVRLPDGHRLHSPESEPPHRRAFRFVEDLMPPALDEATFLAGIDAVQRFEHGLERLPEALTPRPDGCVVECGAYLGHKSIRFAESLVPEGEVLAVEMMPRNVEILRRNVEANDLGERISILEAGVWNEAGEVEVWGKGRQRNSLVPLEHIKVDTGVMVRVDTLDVLLDQWGRPFIDLLYVTINGAEIEALQGLVRRLPTVRGIFIVSPYDRDGVACAETCRELLVGKGCRLIDVGVANIVAAVNPSAAPTS